MKIRNLVFSASVLALAGVGVVTYAQTKPVSPRTSVAVYKSPT